MLIRVRRVAPAMIYERSHRDPAGSSPEGLMDTSSTILNTFKPHSGLKPRIWLICAPVRFVDCMIPVIVISGGRDDVPSVKEKREIEDI